MGRPKKSEKQRNKNLRDIGFKTAIETGVDHTDFDRMKLELTKRGFFLLKGSIKKTDCITDWNKVKDDLSKDDTLRWIFYYFEINGKRIREEEGGRKMKTFEKITNGNGDFSKNCPEDFLPFLKVISIIYIYTQLKESIKKNYNKNLKVISILDRVTFC